MPMGPKTNVSMFMHGELGERKKTKRKKSQQQLLVEKYEATFDTATGSNSAVRTPQPKRQRLSSLSVKTPLTVKALKARNAIPVNFKKRKTQDRQKTLATQYSKKEKKEYEEKYKDKIILWQKNYISFNRFRDEKCKEYEKISKNDSFRKQINLHTGMCFGEKFSCVYDGLLNTSVEVIKTITSLMEIKDLKNLMDKKKMSGIEKLGIEIPLDDSNNNQIRKRRIIYCFWKLHKIPPQKNVIYVNEDFCKLIEKAIEENTMPAFSDMNFKEDEIYYKHSRVEYFKNDLENFIQDLLRRMNEMEQKRQTLLRFILYMSGASTKECTLSKHEFARAKYLLEKISSFKTAKDLEEYCVKIETPKNVNAIGEYREGLREIKEQVEDKDNEPQCAQYYMKSSRDDYLKRCKEEGENIEHDNFVKYCSYAWYNDTTNGKRLDLRNVEHFFNSKILTDEQKRACLCSYLLEAQTLFRNMSEESRNQLKISYGKKSKRNEKPPQEEVMDGTDSEEESIDEDEFLPPQGEEILVNSSEPKNPLFLWEDDHNKETWKQMPLKDLYGMYNTIYNINNGYYKSIKHMCTSVLDTSSDTHKCMRCICGKRSPDAPYYGKAVKTHKIEEFN